MFALAFATALTAQAPEAKYLQYRNGLNVFLVVSDGDEDWDRFGRAKLRRDTQAILDLIAAGKVFEVQGGTRVEIARVGLTSLKVEVLGGPKKGRMGWIEKEYVTDRPPPMPKDEAEKAEPSKPEAEKPQPAEPPRAKQPPPPRSNDERAATLLRSAGGLEKAGKKDGALSLYRQIVKDFPETPSAKVAAERIMALSK